MRLPRQIISDDFPAFKYAIEQQDKQVLETWNLYFYILKFGRDEYFDRIMMPTKCLNLHVAKHIIMISHQKWKINALFSVNKYN